MCLQFNDLSCVIRLVTLDTSCNSVCVCVIWLWAACAAQRVCMCVSGQQDNPSEQLWLQPIGHLVRLPMCLYNMLLTSNYWQSIMMIRSDIWWFLDGWGGFRSHYDGHCITSQEFDSWCPMSCQSNLPRFGQFCSQVSHFFFAFVHYQCIIDKITKSKHWPYKC